MKRVALLFPGQGSQYAGMGKVLCQRYSSAYEVFEEADDILGFPLKKMCFEGSLEELTKTENTQPALLTMSVAMYRIYMKEIGVKPCFTAGHSLGEYSALTCGGAMTFSDALKTVRVRGRLMQEAVTSGAGAMISVQNIPRSSIEEECYKYSDTSEVVGIACYNSQMQNVISGYRSAVEKIGKKLAECGARVIPLKVSAPFHSPLMKQAAEKLEIELRKNNYTEFKCPVLSNVTALPYESTDSIINNLVEQMTMPVRWMECMQYLENQGIDTIVEIGPRTVLKNLAEDYTKYITAFSMDNQNDMDVIKNMAGSFKTRELSHATMDDLRLVITRCLAIGVCTKNNNWDNDEYLKGVIEPYKRIRSLNEDLEHAGKIPTIEQAQEALNMLKSVFVTKRTPYEEQVERFKQIFDDTGTNGIFSSFKV